MRKVLSKNLERKSESLRNGRSRQSSKQLIKTGSSIFWTVFYHFVFSPYFWYIIIIANSSVTCFHLKYIYNFYLIYKSDYFVAPIGKTKMLTGWKSWEKGIWGAFWKILRGCSIPYPLAPSPPVYIYFFSLAWNCLTVQSNPLSVSDPRNCHCLKH